MSGMYWAVIRKGTFLIQTENITQIWILHWIFYIVNYCCNLICDILAFWPWAFSDLYINQIHVG
jgi:hypothetical protein